MSCFALVVVPHCDDVDYYCGGTVAAWTSEGKRVVLAVLTDGSKGTIDPDADPAAVAATRQKEQRFAAAVLGIDHVEFLAFPEGEIENTLDGRREVVRLVRKHRPETIVTLDPRADAIPPGGINHPDHRNTGRLVLDALYPAAHLPTFFRELGAEGLEPHHAAEVMLAATEAPTDYVDVTATLERKIEALRRHESQFGDGEGVAAEARLIAEWNGERAGMKAAETFRRIVNSW